MAKSILPLPLLLLLLLCLLALTSTTYSAVTKPAKPSSFVKTSCRVTRYPSLCVQSLATYSSTIRQSPKQMAQVALAVSLSKARSAKAYVIQLKYFKGLKKKEYRVLKDCVDNVGDSVDRLSQSTKEFSRTGVQARESSFTWHISNVQTWVSAALTDYTTCMDAFAGRAMNGKIKTAIRRRINSVAQVTSNALALVNRFVARP